MSPQPKNPPADGNNTPPSGAQDMAPFVDTLITQGKNLHDQKVKLFEQIGANRDMLRNLVAQGLTTPEQTAAIQGEPESEPVVKDGKPVVKDGKPVTRVKKGTGGLYPLRASKDDAQPATAPAAASDNQPAAA